MQLGRIPDNGLEIVGHAGLNLDGTREGVLNQPGHVVDQMPKLKHDRLTGNAAGEGEDLPHHVAAPIGAGPDRLQHGPSGLAGQFVSQ